MAFLCQQANQQITQGKQLCVVVLSWGQMLIHTALLSRLITMADKLEDFWRIFSHYLTVNSTEEPTYLLTRQHAGSYLALALAAYNTFLLRQKILKNAIALTRSTHPRTVMAASIGVGCLYLAGLTVVWHIPSFFTQLAVRVYCSAENATTTLLMREWLRGELLSEGRVKYILRELA